MLKLGITLAKRKMKAVWEATANFITSGNKVFITSDGDIFNVI